jgi:hypothetical protein
LLIFSIVFAPRRNNIKSERGVRVSNIGYQTVNIEGYLRASFRDAPVGAGSGITERDDNQAGKSSRQKSKFTNPINADFSVQPLAQKYSALPDGQIIFIHSRRPVPD